MDNHDLRVAESLGRLEAGVSGINDRLDKLNGSVARHEKRLGDLETRDAVQEAKEATREKADKNWRETLVPIVKLLMVFALGALGAKSPEIVKAISQ